MSEEGLQLTEPGIDWFAHLGIDAESAARQHRTFCRPCMDWSERRHHLAVGAAMLSRFCGLGWALRDTKSFAIRFNPLGERNFHALFPCGHKAGSRVDHTAEQIDRGAP